MTLAQAAPGQKVRVVGRGLGRGLARHLNALGIHGGDSIVVLRAAPFLGPLLVEVPSTGIRVAVGRGMARSVLVEPADET